MKVQYIGEYQALRLPRDTQITDLYQVRLAIWKVSKKFKKLTGKYPTHIGFPTGRDVELGYIREFIQRYRGKLMQGIDIAYAEILIGICSQDFMVADKPMKWTRKPSLFYEEVRHVNNPRKRSMPKRVSIPDNHPLKQVSSEGKGIFYYNGSL